MGSEVSYADAVPREQLMLQRHAVVLNPRGLQVGNNAKDVEWRSSRRIGSIGLVWNRCAATECRRARLRAEAYKVRRCSVNRRVVASVRTKGLKQQSGVRIPIRSNGEHS